jgi:hypothetical protein
MDEVCSSETYLSTYHIATHCHNTEDLNKNLDVIWY